MKPGKSDTNSKEGIARSISVKDIYRMEDMSKYELELTRKQKKKSWRRKKSTHKVTPVHSFSSLKINELYKIDDMAKIEAKYIRREEKRKRKGNSERLARFKTSFSKHDSVKLSGNHKKRSTTAKSLKSENFLIEDNCHKMGIPVKKQKTISKQTNSSKPDTAYSENAINKNHDISNDNKKHKNCSKMIYEEPTCIEKVGNVVEGASKFTKIKKNDNAKHHSRGNVLSKETTATNRFLGGEGQLSHKNEIEIYSVSKNIPSTLKENSSERNITNNYKGEKSKVNKKNLSKLSADDFSSREENKYSRNVKKETLKKNCHKQTKLYSNDNIKSKNEDNLITFSVSCRNSPEENDFNCSEKVVDSTFNSISSTKRNETNGCHNIKPNKGGTEVDDLPDKTTNKTTKYKDIKNCSDVGSSKQSSKQDSKKYRTHCKNSSEIEIKGKLSHTNYTENGHSKTQQFSPNGFGLSKTEYKKSKSHKVYGDDKSETSSRDSSPINIHISNKNKISNKIKHGHLKDQMSIKDDTNIKSQLKNYYVSDSNREDQVKNTSNKKKKIEDSGSFTSDKISSHHCKTKNCTEQGKVATLDKDLKCSDINKKNTKNLSSENCDIGCSSKNKKMRINDKDSKMAFREDTKNIHLSESDECKRPIKLFDKDISRREDIVYNNNDCSNDASLNTTREKLLEDEKENMKRNKHFSDRRDYSMKQKNLSEDIIWIKPTMVNNEMKCLAVETDNNNNLAGSFSCSTKLKKYLSFNKKETNQSQVEENSNIPKESKCKNSEEVKDKKLMNTMKLPLVGSYLKHLYKGTLSNRGIPFLTNRTEETIERKSSKSKNNKKEQSNNSPIPESYGESLSSKKISKVGSSPKENHHQQFCLECSKNKGIRGSEKESTTEMIRNSLGMEASTNEDLEDASQLYCKRNCEYYMKKGTKTRHSKTRNMKADREEIIKQNYEKYKLKVEKLKNKATFKSDQSENFPRETMLSEIKTVYAPLHKRKPNHREKYMVDVSEDVNSTVSSNIQNSRTNFINSTIVRIMSFSKTVLSRKDSYSSTSGIKLNPIKTFFFSSKSKIHPTNERTENLGQNSIKIPSKRAQRSKFSMVNHSHTKQRNQINYKLTNENINHEEIGNENIQFFKHGKMNYLKNTVSKIQSKVSTEQFKLKNLRQIKNSINPTINYRLSSDEASTTYSSVRRNVYLRIKEPKKMLSQNRKHTRYLVPYNKQKMVKHRDRSLSRSNIKHGFNNHLILNSKHPQEEQVVLYNSIEKPFIQDFRTVPFVGSEHPQNFFYCEQQKQKYFHQQNLPLLHDLKENNNTGDLKEEIVLNKCSAENNNSNDASAMVIPLLKLETSNKNYLKEGGDINENVINELASRIAKCLSNTKGNDRGINQDVPKESLLNNLEGTNIVEKKLSESNQQCTEKTKSEVDRGCSGTKDGSKKYKDTKLVNKKEKTPKTVKERKDNCKMKKKEKEKSTDEFSKDSSLSTFKDTASSSNTLGMLKDIKKIKTEILEDLKQVGNGMREELEKIKTGILMEFKDLPVAFHQIPVAKKESAKSHNSVRIKKGSDKPGSQNLLGRQESRTLLTENSLVRQESQMSLNRINRFRPDKSVNDYERDTTKKDKSNFKTLVSSEDEMPGGDSENKKMETSIYRNHNWWLNQECQEYTSKRIGHSRRQSLISWAGSMTESAFDSDDLRRKSHKKNSWFKMFVPFHRRKLSKSSKSHNRENVFASPLDTDIKLISSTRPNESSNVAVIPPLLPSPQKPKKKNKLWGFVKRSKTDKIIMDKDSWQTTGDIHSQKGLLQENPIGLQNEIIKERLKEMLKFYQASNKLQLNLNDAISKLLSSEITMSPEGVYSIINQQGLKEYLHGSKIDSLSSHSNSEDYLIISEEVNAVKFLIFLGFPEESIWSIQKDLIMITRLESAIKEVKCWTNKLLKSQGLLIYMLAVFLPEEIRSCFCQIVEAIVNNRIKNNEDLTNVICVLKQNLKCSQGIPAFIPDEAGDKVSNSGEQHDEYKTMFNYLHFLAKRAAYKSGLNLSSNSNSLIASMVVKFFPGCEYYLPLMAHYIGQEIISNREQLTAAMTFLGNLNPDEFDHRQFEQKCGLPVGKLKMEKTSRPELIQLVEDKKTFLKTSGLLKKESSKMNKNITQE